MRIYHRLSLVIVSFLATSICEGSRLNSYEDYKDTWSVTFGTGITSRVGKHQETSTDGSFTAINEDIRVRDQSISLSVMKEFLNQQRFSFTAKIFGGINDGKYESEYDAAVSDSKNNSKFSEELSGTHFGAGISLNYNTFLYGFKLQPYIGVDIFQDQGDLVLTHNNSSTVTTHTYSDQVALISLGFRAFDSEVGLMSYFIASMPQAIGESLTTSTVINGLESTGTMIPAEYLRAPFQFSLGFGFYF